MGRARGGGVDGGVGAADRNAEALAADLRRRLVEHRRAEAAAGRAGGDDLESAVAEMVDDHAAVLSERRRSRIRELILRDTVGLGPLEQVLADPAVTEVMVNGPHEVYVERRGRIEPTEVRFASEGALRDAIERILAPLGRRVDELSPMVDGRLADGSRVNVVIPPLSVDGPALSIRRFTGARPGPDELVASGTLTAELRDLLAEAVRGRRSMLISGGTGSGKTTLLNALSAYIGSEERVITIEDAAELRLRQPHVVRLESRPPSVEERGEVTIRDLLRNALRMRPDRIVIGEVRGGRGPRPADGAQHRTRRGAVDSARELARRCAAPPRDAGVDGRRRASARSDPRPGEPRHRARRPPGPDHRRASGEWSRLARWWSAPVGSAELGEVWQRGLTVPTRWPRRSCCGRGGRRDGRGGCAGGSPRDPGPGALARRRGRAAATRGARGLRSDGGRAAPAGGCGNRRAASLCAVGGRTRPLAARGRGRSRRRGLGGGAPPGAVPARGRARASAGGDGGRGRACRRQLGPGGARRRRRLDRGTAGRRVGPPARRPRAGCLDRAALAALRPAFGRSASTRSPQRFSRSSSAAATSPGFCDASPPHRRSAIGSPRTPTRPPPRLASPVCWWSPCRREPRCSPS